MDFGVRGGAGVCWISRSVSKNININIKHRKRFHSKFIDAVNKASYLQMCPIHAVNIHVFLFSSAIQTVTCFGISVRPIAKSFLDHHFWDGNKGVTQMTQRMILPRHTVIHVFSFEISMLRFFFTLKQSVELWTTPHLIYSKFKQLIWW